jgi:hypothetical protein
MTRRLSAACLASLVLACGPKTSQQVDASQPGRQVTEKRLEEDGLILQEVDLNNDGQAEIFNTFRERSSASRLLIEKRVDLNFDGLVDVITTYDELGELFTEEIDSDFDGRLDMIDHYQDGTRVMSEVDTDYDGRSNIFSYFLVDANGFAHIDRKERDTNGDGQIDYWEKFDGKGNVIKTGRDDDGDGKLDVRDE